MSFARSVQRKSAHKKVRNMSGSKVKIKNGELAPAINALTLLGSEKFGISFSFAIKRVLAALRPLLETYNESRRELVEAHAKKGEDGKFLTSENGQEYVMADAEWVPKMQELDSLEAGEVPGIKATDIVAACDKAELEVTANTLWQLGPILIDDLED